MPTVTDAAPARTELIGRDEELRRLGEVLGRDGALLVVGEPGIGKTALLRAAMASGDRRAWTGGGFDTLAWMPYLALTLATGARLDGDAAWVADTVERVVGPDVLVIDDVSSVDAGTLDVLGRLVGRVAMLLAGRPGDPEARAALDMLVEAGAERLDLAPLSDDDAERLARSVAPGLGAARLGTVVERAAGNPLLVEVLATSGETTSLRLAVAARLSTLPAADREGLGLLALAGHPLPVLSLGAAADDLARGGWVRVSSGEASIRHALLADAVVADLDPASRRRLHARLASLVETPGERARHCLEAGDREAARAAALEAVATATSVGERAAHLGIAAASSDGPSADVQRIEAAAALRVAGDLNAATTLLDAVVGDDPELRARAEAIRARVCWSAGDPEAMRAAIERGLALVVGTGSPAEAMLRAEAVVITALVDGRFEEGLRESEEAVALAERSGADRTRPLLLRATLLAGLGMDGWAEALEAVMASAREGGDAETELSAANNLVAGHEMHGDPAAGRAIATAMIDRSTELRLAGWARQSRAMLVNVDLHAGDLEGAVERAETLLEEPLDPLAAAQVELACACALVDLGRAEDAAGRLRHLQETVADDAVALGGVGHIVAEGALWAGRPEAALREVERYRALDLGDHPTSRLVDDVAGWAAIDAGVALPARLATGDAEGMLAGAALERDAIETLAAGDPGAAASDFDAAAQRYAGVHRRGELRARWAAAEARRRSGDPDAAIAALEALEREALDQGFEPLAGRIRRSLRLAGVRRAATRGDGDATAQDDRPTRAGPRLTSREREIVGLVAGGASNVEIARRLGLGRPTVARLLGSAMDKLGVDSRAQVVAMVDA